MYKSILTLLLASVVFLSACGKKELSDAEKEALKAGVHKVEALEVLQVSSYTYMRVVEDGKEYWIAGPKMDGKKGEYYYYMNAMEMKDFQSTELNRKFDVILFVNSLSSQLPGSSNANGMQPSNGMGNTPQKPTIEKTDVKVEKYPGGISIAELFAAPEKFSGKEVKIRGTVTKVNNGIMGKNWLHIQDGTETGGNFDLTVTTLKECNAGEVVAFAGKIALNKDFGYGYSYKVLLEDAVEIK